MTTEAIAAEAKTKSGRMEDCPGYDHCKAPICPLDGAGIWYPDEDICTRRPTLTPWVKTQRKIAKRIRAEDKYFFFTVEDLKSIKTVRKGIRGRSPDIPLTVPLVSRGVNAPGEGKTGVAVLKMG